MDWILQSTDSQTLKTNICLPKGADGQGMAWALGTVVCTLWYIELHANGELLYSMWNSIQYSVIIYMGKESEKECMCIYVYNWITLLCSRNYHHVVNQLYFNKTKKKREEQRLTLLKLSTGGPGDISGFLRWSTLLHQASFIFSELLGPKVLSWNPWFMVMFLLASSWLNRIFRFPKYHWFCSSLTFTSISWCLGFWINKGKFFSHTGSLVL